MARPGTATSSVSPVPNFQRREIFAHIGGRPLGMQFDREENLIVSVAGMGVYGVRPGRRGVQGY